jgi:hypothetical protein
VRWPSVAAGRNAALFFGTCQYTGSSRNTFHQRGTSKESFPNDSATVATKLHLMPGMSQIARTTSFLSFLLLTSGAIWAGEPVEVVASPAKPALRTELVPLESGAELITFFEPLPQQPASASGHTELPLLTILKDTLNDSDPENDRIRQVWVFTYSQPSVWQRIAGGIPFLYHRAGLDRGPGPKPPRAVVDLGDPSHGTWTGMAFAGVQSEVLNPIGALARLTTHSFFDNYGEYRKTHLWEASDVLSTLLPATLSDVAADEVTPVEIQAVEERLELTGHPLGGLVADEYLERDREKQRAKDTETRGHNWELLRQRAEDSGLYLAPLEPEGLAASFAILWVAQTDLGKTPEPNFDRQFLNISNPFSDERLCHWDGYSETWNLDRNGVPVAADSPAADSNDAQPVRMIPLGLYALDHPHTPLLLADFRGSGHPPRREIGLKIAEDVTSGVLSITGFGHLGYLALKSSLLFVHGRHGGATDRSARRRAFVLVRHAIGSDPNIDPQLRKELLEHIEKVDVNPIERSWDHEIRDGWRQYEALIDYAHTTGLSREVDRDRGDEMRTTVHGPVARAFLHLASVATAGLYNHHDTMNQSLAAKLDQQRREARLKHPAQPLPPESDPLVAGTTANEVAAEAQLDSSPAQGRPGLSQ